MPFLEKFIGFRHAGTSIGCQLHKAESLRRSRYANWLWNIYIYIYIYGVKESFQPNTC